MRKEDASVTKNSTSSWKKNHPSSLLSNSVQKANRAVKQALSHPEEIAIEHAFNSIEHAENALTNAINHEEHMDIVEQNKQMLEEIKQDLNEVKGT